MRSACVAFGLLVLSAAATAQQYVISTYAGGGLPPGPAVDGSIGAPMGIATDAGGNIFFASPILNSILKLAPNGMLTRIAGTSRRGYSGDGGPAERAQLNDPGGVAVDGAGNLFIADTGNNRIRRVSPSGIITTVAGNGSLGFSGDGGPATTAQVSGGPLAVDAAGNLYIADGVNYRVRKVSPRGIITTVAGNGTCCFSGDGGPATSAQVVAVGVAVDRGGNLLIADSVRIRRVSPSGIISTVPGSESLPASGNRGVAWGVAVDGAGNVLVAALGAILRISPSGTVTTVAGGLPGGGFSGDGGPATSARLSGALSVAADDAGNFFIAEAGDGRIRRVSTGGMISTVAGNGTGVLGVSYFSGDGGPAPSAELNHPSSVAVDGSGNLFIADSGNNRIRKVTASGIISTVAGNGTAGFSGDGGPAVNAQLNYPRELAVDGAGNLFFGDAGVRVRKISVSGIISTVAGTGLRDFPVGIVDGGPAISAALGFVTGIAVDKSGNLFIADLGYNRIRKVSADGLITTVAGGGGSSGPSGDGGPATKAQLSPRGVAVDGGGNLFIADTGYGRIRKVSPDGIISTVAGSRAFSASSGDGGLATSAFLSAPTSVTVDSAGNLFIADPGVNFFADELPVLPCCDHRIRKIPPDGIITTIAGTGTPGFSGDGGPASTAALNGPASLAVDSADNIYVADTLNNVVRILRPSGRSLLIGAVVDAANPSAASVSPGKIVVIYGAALGPVQLVENRASNGALGSELGGTTVSFNGIAAPILYTSATQIAAVVPYGITGPTAQVLVTYQGKVSNELTVAVAASAPSLFTVNQTGAGQAAAINAVDGTVNSAANPVKIGGFISLYATGEGQTGPAGVDGRLGGSAPTNPILPVSVTVGGIPARVQYAGSVQGQVAGLMQVNVMIPDGVEPGGYVPVVLQVGDRSSGPAVWIAVSGN